MQVEWWSVIPFVVLLLCIALLPLIPATTHAWERNGVKLLVALACGLPVAAWFVLTGYGSEVSHALVEYVQFIMLLLALFVVSGGIFLDGDIRPTPATTPSSWPSAVLSRPSWERPARPCCSSARC